MSAEFAPQQPTAITVTTPAQQRRYRYLAVLIGLLLVIFASRVIRLTTLELDPDEVWSVWQTFGSPADIIKWTPYDWNPLYYLIVGGWRALAGIHPFVVRLLAVFTFMIALALLFRITRRLYGATAGIIAVAVCAALGYAIHISLMLRAYGMVFCVAILAWWLTLRYFSRPTIKRGLLLGISLGILFYLHSTGIFAIGLLGLYALIVYRRSVLRGWLPLVVAALLIVPAALGKAMAADIRAVDNAAIMQQWLASGGTILWQVMRDLVINFTGYNFALWAALMGIATVLILERYRWNRRIGALAVWVFAPLFLFVMGFVGAYTNRHTTWLMAGFAVWIGAGLKFLPRAALVGVLGILMLLMFTPVPIEQYKPIPAPLVQTFNWLEQQVQNGDSVLIDPNYSVVAPEVWDYFTRAYFPNGLNYVTAPENNRRVWYIYGAIGQSPEIAQQVEQNRIVTEQMATAALTVQLYEAPPDVTGVVFDNGMRFHGVDPLNSVSPIPVWREGETIRLRLWWSVDQPLTGDLSVSTFVLQDAEMLVQVDGPPQVINGAQETSRWQPNQYYIEERELPLKYPLDMGDYWVQLVVYQSWDGTRFIPAGDDDGQLPIFPFYVMSWSSPH